MNALQTSFSFVSPSFQVSALMLGLQTYFLLQAHTLTPPALINL